MSNPNVPQRCPPACRLSISKFPSHATYIPQKGFPDPMFPKDVTYTRRSVAPRVYPKKYAHGFCFAVLCCGYTLTDFPISIRLPSMALWQSNDCPSASKATLMTMDKYFMWIHYERSHNHNKAKHNKTVCIFLGIYCIFSSGFVPQSLCPPVPMFPSNVLSPWLPNIP